MMSALLRSFRSELVRLRRLWTLPAAATVFTIVATVVTFSGASPGGPPFRGPDGAGAVGTTADALTASDGIVAGIATAGTLVTLVCLVLWALSVARDLQTGSVRVLLVTEARRLAYLGGKLFALVTATAVTVVASVGASVATALLMAPTQDIATGQWTPRAVWSAAANLGVAAGLWGTVGATIAMVSRSAAASIAGGLGYLLVGEKLLGLVWDTASSWLPAGTASNVLAGGSDDTSYPQSLVLAALFIVAGLVISLTTLSRRDITD
ncbi:MAG: hypothetical protein IT195_02740 [Microthrixaceae bacterium]|nr:hypothetical protein [Microthrixaceae bacterium]